MEKDCRARQIISLVESLMRENALEEARSKSITVEELQDLERRFNAGIWNHFGVYLVLNGTHFKERIGRDDHQERPITTDEIYRMLMNFSRLYLVNLLERIPPHREYQGVIRDPIGFINIGFILKPHEGYRGFTRLFVAKMILRKQNFTTSDRIFTV